MTDKVVAQTSNPCNFQRASRGWLIECKHCSVPSWWNGMRFDLIDDKAWDADSTKGIVFADWASASAMLNNLRVETMQRSEKRGPHAVMEKMQLAVTEHEWPRAAPETPAALSLNSEGHISEMTVRRIDTSYVVTWLQDGEPCGSETISEKLALALIRNSEGISANIPAEKASADPYKAVCQGGTGGKCCQPDCEICWPDPPPLNGEGGQP